MWFFTVIYCDFCEASKTWKDVRCLSDSWASLTLRSHSMRSMQRQYETVERPSVRPSVCPYASISLFGRRTPLRQVCCCGPVRWRGELNTDLFWHAVQLLLSVVTRRRGFPRLRQRRRQRHAGKCHHESRRVVVRHGQEEMGRWLLISRRREISFPAPDSDRHTRRRASWRCDVASTCEDLLHIVWQAA